MEDGHLQYYWTDEKHMEFLESLEQGFLRSMDRQLLRDHADHTTASSYSSMDSTITKQLHHSSGWERREASTGSKNMRIRGQSSSKRRRSIPYQQYQYQVLQDQVVPQMENGTEGQDDNFLASST